MSAASKSDEEIRAALAEFVAEWTAHLHAHPDTTERGEAQSFLNDLFDCYGTARLGKAKFEPFEAGAGFYDLLWPGQLIVEMKRPGEKLDKLWGQVEKYWWASEKEDTPKARWVVYCNFWEFEVWEPGRFHTKARARFTLADLVEHAEDLVFLADPEREPRKVVVDQEMTKAAAETVSKLFHLLRGRRAASEDVLREFLLQTIWCLFAERFGMLKGKLLTETILEYTEPPGDSTRPTRPLAPVLHYLFFLLSDEVWDEDYRRVGVYADVPSANGPKPKKDAEDSPEHAGLFAKPVAVELNPVERAVLRAAVSYKWAQIDPTVFGSLLEGILGEQQRAKLGAHYTRESDIQKIVGPTIIRPWERRIEQTATTEEAVALLHELCAFRVLDPACGCGNFLYVAYRELRALEYKLKQRIGGLAQRSGLPFPEHLPFFPLRNMLGIDKEATAVQIARVTLWMGQRQAIEMYGPAESPLPLLLLEGIQGGDALELDWPEADCVIGNPPFLGKQFMREAFNEAYLQQLDAWFGNGVQELCTYWFRKAADYLKPGQRAGFVGTNSIAQVTGKKDSLDYVVAKGGVITDAVSSQTWAGDAKVHVAIANWVQNPLEPPTEFILDGEPVTGIASDLRELSADSWQPVALRANAGKCFQGPIPVGEGFILEAAEAGAILKTNQALYRQVVRPYLVGEDIARHPGQGPSRWVIDFGIMAREEAKKFPKAFTVVEERVKPERDGNRDKGFREKWWQFGRPRGEMRTALAPLPRYLAGTATGKRLLWAWQEPWTLPSNLTNVVATAADYDFGILSSFAHGAWARKHSSTLKGDLRYTPTTAFATFPWPEPTNLRRAAVEEAARAVESRRSEICRAEQFGLTKLYNEVDQGSYQDLKNLHKDLDAAVAAAYGWPKRMAQDDRAIVQKLTELNKKHATEEAERAAKEAAAAKGEGLFPTDEL